MRRFKVDGPGIKNDRSKLLTQKDGNWPDLKVKIGRPNEDIRSLGAFKAK